MCKFGKHRSRWLISTLETWLDDTHPDSDYWVNVEHLSENNRRQELDHYYNLIHQGYNKRQAMASAKGMGLRRKRRDFASIRWNWYNQMKCTGYQNHWIDVSRYPPTAQLLDWCLDCLPFSGCRPHFCSFRSKCKPQPKFGRLCPGSRDFFYSN